MTSSSIRIAAYLTTAALLYGCTAESTTKVASPSAPAAATVAPAPPGPANALVSAAGKPGAVPLDATQRQMLTRALAALPATMRPRLRYAVAAGDDGRRHLVLYDGEGLPADGRHPGKKFEYVVFRILNANHGEHYDPQQNTVIAAMPSPDRDTTAEVLPAAK